MRRRLTPIASVTAVLAIIATLVAVRLTSAEMTAGRNGGPGRAVGTQMTQITVGHWIRPGAPGQTEIGP